MLSLQKPIIHIKNSPLYHAPSPPIVLVSVSHVSGTFTNCFYIKENHFIWWVEIILSFDFKVNCFSCAVVISSFA